MFRQFVIWFVSLTVVAMTAVSLLPHHHHHDCGDVVCLLPYDCNHDKECGHEDTQSGSKKKDCGFERLDLSIVSVTEKQVPLVVSIDLFIGNILKIFLNDNSVALELFIDRNDAIESVNHVVSCGLRAPPVSW